MHSLNDNISARMHTHTSDTPLLLDIPSQSPSSSARHWVTPKNRDFLLQWENYSDTYLVHKHTAVRVEVNTESREKEERMKSKSCGLGASHSQGCRAYFNLDRDLYCFFLLKLTLNRQPNGVCVCVHHPWQPAYSRVCVYITLEQSWENPSSIPVIPPSTTPHRKKQGRNGNEFFF